MLYPRGANVGFWMASQCPSSPWSPSWDPLTFVTLQWSHNGQHGVSYHRRLYCLHNRLFRRRSKQTSKLCLTGLCEVIGEIPVPRASNAENVSIWWRHHELDRPAVASVLTIFDNGVDVMRKAGPCITNVFATCRVNSSQLYRSFQRKLRSHWLKFLRHVAITLVIQGPGLQLPVTSESRWMIEHISMV